MIAVGGVTEFGFLDAALIGDDGAEGDVVVGAWIDIAMDILMNDADRIVGRYLLGDTMDGTA